LELVVIDCPNKSRNYTKSIEFPAKGRLQIEVRPCKMWHIFNTKKDEIMANNYKVKDISLADWGRKEIKLAEAEMPGLMSSKRRVRKRKAT
jgi:hypothetical protein